MIDHKNIHEAINAVMGEVGYVKKQKSNDVKYTFAGEAALISALRPAMVEHGIYMHVSKIENVSREHLTTKSGSQMVNTLTTGIVRFTHTPSGTSVDSWATGEGFDSGDKSANKAMTGLYKYAMRQTFCIETGDDPDTFSAERKAPNEKGKVSSTPAPKVANEIITDSEWERFETLRLQVVTENPTLKLPGYSRANMKPADLNNVIKYFISKLEKAGK